MPFDDSVLQKIYRQYSDDEMVAFLKERLKKSEFDNGVLKSELEEQIHNNKVLGKKMNEMGFAQAEKRKVWQIDLDSRNRRIRELEDMVCDLNRRLGRSNKIS